MTTPEVKDPFALTDRDLFSREPESLNVGQLNRAVRRLREELKHRPGRARAQGIELGLVLAATLVCAACRAGRTPRGVGPQWYHMKQLRTAGRDEMVYEVTECPSSPVHEQLKKLGF